MEDRQDWSQWQKGQQGGAKGGSTFPSKEENQKVVHVL
jgi:hypothetical protein